MTRRAACVQITVGLFALLFFFSAFIWGQPYRSSFPNTFQAYIQLTLFITLYCKCNQRIRLCSGVDHVLTHNLFSSNAAMHVFVLLFSAAPSDFAVLPKPHIMAWTEWSMSLQMGWGQLVVAKTTAAGVLSR